ncbi:dehydrogenase/reductase SDR family member on chromosome X-like [Pectinophora gossypiella]|uniref:dehydrogenase/reductase SDR family member on chromosome X-like n=1 Tax=Pectinophora gossypiella TaxID=13191 RepID=UPI00214EF91D|nr:dehydrogenase/reductase SDR family member on chromosome X-like [Pectinophora gossypiella]
MFVIASLVVVGTVAAVYWSINRDKPLKYILSELQYTITMQAVGVGGVIDDWVNISKNKIVLPDANKKIAVMTGGARGIGTEVIRGLLKANMVVVIGIRKPEQSKKIAETMENGENLHAYELDLQSLRSVKIFAEKVNKKYPEIHILVNNAGIMFGDYKLTEDAMESQFQVNHLSHFYLTHLMLPALKNGGSLEKSSRIVNVTSSAHYIGKISFDDVNMKEHYDTIAAYCQSKLAQLLSTRYINQLLSKEGCRVKSYAVHPGVVDTDLFENTLLKQIFPWILKLFFKTPEKGAVSILHACFNKELEDKGGLYISNCIEGISSRSSKDIEYQKQLFELSCKLLGIRVEAFGKS